MGSAASRIPLVSQVRSLVQAISGDTAGARQTQIDFARNVVNVATAGGPGAIALLPIIMLRDVVSAIVQASQDNLPTSASLTARPNWMARDGMRALRLDEMLIPGTHDSTASRFVYPVPFALDFARAQILSIRQQLDGGIRYLDVRVSRFAGALYSGHTFPTFRLTEVFSQIRDFLDTNPTEKVILAIQRDTNGTPEDLDAARSLAGTIFGETRFVEEHDLASPIGVWPDAAQLVYVRFLHAEGVFNPPTLAVDDESLPPHLRPPGLVRNSWGETRSSHAVDVVHHCIGWASANPRQVRRLNLLALQATPDKTVGSVGRSILGQDLQVLAGRSNFAIARHLLTHPVAMANANVINMDFANDHLIGAIVAMNPSTFEEAGCTSVEEDTTVRLLSHSYVAYGADGKFKHSTVKAGYLTFDNDTFGDPIYNTRKNGYFKAIESVPVTGNMILPHEMFGFHGGPLPTAPVKFRVSKGPNIMLTVSGSGYSRENGIIGANILVDGKQVGTMSCYNNNAGELHGDPSMSHHVTFVPTTLHIPATPGAHTLQLMPLGETLSNEYDNFAASFIEVDQAGDSPTLGRVIFDQVPGGVPQQAEFTVEQGQSILLTVSGSGRMQSRGHLIGLNVRVDGDLVGSIGATADRLDEHRVFVPTTVRIPLTPGTHTLQLAPGANTVTDANDFLSASFVEVNDQTAGVLFNQVPGPLPRQATFMVSNGPDILLTVSGSARAGRNGGMGLVINLDGQPVGVLLHPESPRRTPFMRTTIRVPAARGPHTLQLVAGRGTIVDQHDVFSASYIEAQ